MDNQVFRKVSMERLSSPEQLDSMMKVTSPKGWLALIAIGLLIASAVIWGFTGSLSTKLHGQGVLIKPGGLHQIYSSSSGQITDIRAVIDHAVNKGDVIARIYQPEMLEQMKLLKNEISAAQNELQLTDSVEQKAALESRIIGLQTELDRVTINYDLASKVVSPYTGRVIEVNVNKGDRINSGLPLVTVELDGDGLKELIAVMYIPAFEGKKILPGMDVQISPTSVNKEEYGFIEGRVISVGEFPATRQGMMMTLGNEALVNQLSGGGASLEVRIDLTPDIHTVSGYKWSSADGPPMELNSGTLVMGSIVLSKKRPITTVIPQIK